MDENDLNQKYSESSNAEFDTPAIEAATLALLQAVGERPEREGLPGGCMYPELLAGYLWILKNS